MKRLLLYLFLGIILPVACIEEISFGGKGDGAQRLVVEGGVTSLPGPQTIRLHYNTDYVSDPNLFVQGAPVDNAKVDVIEVETGKIIPFEYFGRGEYQSLDANFSGKPGMSYFMEALVDGITYLSSTIKMRETPPIDSLYYAYDSLNKDLDLFVSIPDPPERGDYYRWEWEGYKKILTSLPGPPAFPDTFDCCTECFIKDKKWEIKIFDDSFINGNQILDRKVMDIPLDNNTDFLIEVFQYSLSREEYEFWRQLSLQSENKGGLFDPPPFNIEGNITGSNNIKALGFFSVSDVTLSYLQVQRKPWFPWPDIISQTDCRTIRGAFTQPPKNWVE